MYYLVQGRLPVEEYHITILQVSLNHKSWLQLHRRHAWLRVPQIDTNVIVSNNILRCKHHITESSQA
jgi:hypothetical protein